MLSLNLNYKHILGKIKTAQFLWSFSLLFHLLLLFILFFITMFLIKNANLDITSSSTKKISGATQKTEKVLQMERHYRSLREEYEGKLQAFQKLDSGVQNR